MFRDVFDRHNWRGVLLNIKWVDATCGIQACPKSATRSPSPPCTSHLHTPTLGHEVGRCGLTLSGSAICPRSHDLLEEDTKQPIAFPIIQKKKKSDPKCQECPGWETYKNEEFNRYLDFRTDLKAGDVFIKVVMTNTEACSEGGAKEFSWTH